MSSSYIIPKLIQCRRLYSEASGEQPHPVLQVRLRYIRRLIFPSLLKIRHENSSTPSKNVLFHISRTQLRDPMSCTMQVLSSLDIPDAHCQVIAWQIASFIGHIAEEEYRGTNNFRIVVEVDYVRVTAKIEQGKVIQVEPTPGRSREELGNCSICLDEIAEEEVIKIPCGHVYHKPCILKWLHNNNSCPLCRRKLPPLDQQ